MRDNCYNKDVCKEKFIHVLNMKRKCHLIILFLIVNLCIPYAVSLVEIFRWKYLKCEGAEDTQSRKVNIVPFGASHYRGRFFITIPRRPSVPYTLNVVDINEIHEKERSPILKAYPDVLSNTIPNRVGQIFVISLILILCYLSI